jgi:hypothetical protein
MHNNVNEPQNNTHNNATKPQNNTTQHTEQTQNFEKISLENLQKKYGTGRPPLYARMKYLRMTTWKIQGKAYLDAEQVAYMDGLHEHIKSTGRMDGYPIPDPTGPIDDEEPTSTTAITIEEPQQITKATPNYAVKGKRSQSSQQVDDIPTIIKSAQGKAAGILIAENLIARQYFENPEMLPDEARIELSPLPEYAIRELMEQTALEQGLNLKASELSKLQERAGGNPMLAKRAIEEEYLGLEVEGADHRRYFDITPLILLAGIGFVIIRFIGLGTSNQALYIFGGIAAAIFLGLSRLLYNLPREGRRIR